MNAKMLTPKRGEIGLAKFHHGIGLFSFMAGIALMLVSFTALYWFGGVIGLPKIARVAVACAFEVLAATLASSATTAKRKTGDHDVSAWAAFGAVVSVNAFANVMHVIVFLVHAKPGTAAADLPPELRTSTWFVVAACVFAAVCALGGTLGVHRFGWLRANGADADWTDAEDGSVVVEQKPAPRPQPKPKPAPESRPVPTAPAVQATAPVPAPRPAAPASTTSARQPEPTRAEDAPAVRAEASQDEPSIEDTVREIARQMIAEDDSVKPNGTEVRRRAGLTRDDKPVPQTTRDWIKSEYDGYLAARADTSDARADLRAELNIADPPEVDLDDDAPTARHAANVA